MTTLPLLALTIPHFQGGDAQEKAFAEARRILTAFEVPGPYEVLPPDESTGRHNVLRAGDGRSYRVVSMASGRLESIRRTAEDSLEEPQARPEGARTPEAQIAKAESALRRAFGTGTIHSTRSKHRNLDAFVAQISVEGHPFIGHVPVEFDEYSYSVDLDPRSGDLVSFWNVPAIPNLDRDPQRLDAKRATTIVEKLIHVRPPKRSTEWYVARSTKFDRSRFQHQEFGQIYDPEPRLGWYLPEDAWTARLAWRVPYEQRWRTVRDTIKAATYGLDALVIDAATGKPLSPLPTDTGNL